MVKFKYEIATVKNGVVDTVGKGYVTITASTSYGAATCLIHVMPRESVRFCYASPNSAPLNSNVSFKAITDTGRVGVYFVVTNGSTSYKVTAKIRLKTVTPISGQVHKSFQNQANGLLRHILNLKPNQSITPRQAAVRARCL